VLDEHFSRVKVKQLHYFLKGSIASPDQLVCLVIEQLNNVVLVGKQVKSQNKKLGFML
jgi:hypothetical protein